MSRRRGLMESVSTFGNSFRRVPSRLSRRWKSFESEESNTVSNTQHEEAEQQRILIGNLVKSGRLSVDEAMSFAESTGLTGSNVTHVVKTTFNFGVYKYTKDKSRTERHILQFDFNEQTISTIQKGKFGKKIAFNEIRDYDSEDDLRFFIYCDEGEMEYDADSAEEKNKICALLDGIVVENKSALLSGGLGSLSRSRFSTLSPNKVIKEGQIEKRGHNAAFLTWAKRFIRIKEGELAYYKIGEENATALNIVKLGPGHSFIKKYEHNVFIVSTQKKEYSFRIMNPNNTKDVKAIKKERDEWFGALSHALQPSSPYVADISPLGSPTLQKQDILNTALEQEEFLKQIVESLQQELEQLMSIMNVLDAPVHATSQMKKVNEIVQKLNTQIKTGLLAWTMKSMAAMYNFSSPPTSPGPLTISRRNIGHPLNSIREVNGVPADDSGGKSNESLLPTKMGDDGVYTETFGDVKGISPRNISNSNHIPESKNGNDNQHLTAGVKTESTTSSLDSSQENNSLHSSYNSTLNSSEDSASRTSVHSLPSPITTPSLSSSSVVPPPPPLPGGVAPPPPPPPFGMGLKSALPPKPVVKPSTKVRPFFWTKVPNNLLLSSMWKKAEDRMNELDFKMIEHRFQVEEKHNSTEISQAVKKKSLLDNKRAQNLEIFLTGVRLNPKDIDRRLKFLDENDGGLPLEIIISLKRFQPSTEEIEMYKNYKGSKENLPKTDHFMMKLCEISDLNARLDLLLFILEFPLQYEELSPMVSSVLKCCDDIIRSKSLQTVMEYILAIGNFLNGGTGRGAAHGFQISSLPKLSDTRSSDKSYTLLHLLVDVLSDKKEDALSLCEDLSSIKDAVEASVKGLTAEVEVLCKSLAKITKLNSDLHSKRKNSDATDENFHNDVNKFVSDYEFTLRDLNDRCDKMRESYSKLLTFFGEPSGKNSEDVFSDLHKFLTKFSSVVEEKNKRKDHDISGKDGLKSPEQHKQLIDEIKNKKKTSKPKLEKQQTLPKGNAAEENWKSTSLKRQGTLQKLSGGEHRQPKWDVRHFELDEYGYLCYFEKAGGKLKGKIYLREAEVVISKLDKLKVEIITEERTYVLKTNSEKDAIAWKNDIANFTK